MLESDLCKLEFEEDKDWVVTDIENLYHLANEPPEMPLNDFIVLYKQTGDEIYIQYFLHRYEPDLNGRIWKICDKQKLNCRFEDLKQVIVTAILECLPDYDLSVGTTLLQYVDPYINGAVYTYLRQYGSAAFSLNSNEYKTLRKVNAIYYSSNESTEQERYAEVTGQTGISELDAQQIIVGGQSFRYPYTIDYTIKSSDGDNEPVAEKIPDLYSNPAEIVSHGLLYDDLVDAIESQPDKPKTVLLEDLGIKCLYCGRTGRRMPQQDIANLYELYSTRAVQKLKDKAVETMVLELTAKGWLRSMKIHLVEKKMDGKTALFVTYAYYPMFSDDKGLLEFDLNGPAEKGYMIDRFTSWDRQYPFFKRLVREVAKMQGKGEYPKERLLVWWA